jgi:hypothetical protein
MITSSENRRWPGDVEISNVQEAGLPAPSLVRTAKIATIESKKSERLGTLPRRDRKDVARHLEEALRDAWRAATDRARRGGASTTDSPYDHTKTALSSRSIPRSVRPLRTEERELVGALIASSTGSQHLANDLGHRLVEEVNDGAMGSLSFVDETETDSSFGAVLAEGTFLDEDGILVSVALYVDGRGELFELDVWKTDFSALKRFPALAEVQITPARPAASA